MRSRAEVRNSVSIITGNAVNKGISIVLLAMLAGYLGPEGFGRYSFVIAYVSFFGIFTDLGVNTVSTRDISCNTGDERRAFGDVIAVRAMLTAVAIVLVVLTLWATGYPKETIVLAGAASLALVLSFRGIFLRNVFEVPFLARLKMDRPAMVNVANEALVLAVTLLVISAGGTLFTIILLMNLAYLPGFLVLAWLACRIIRPDFRMIPGRWHGLFRRSIGLGVSVMLEGVFILVPIFVLTKLSTDASVGLYSLAFRLVASVWIIPVAIMQTLLPALSREHSEAGGGGATMAKGLKVVAGAGVATAAAGVVFAGPLVEFIAGAEFRAASSALAIMSCGTLFYFINTVFFYAFAATERQRLTVVSWTAVAMVSIVSSVVLVPGHAHIGAAVSYTLALGSGTAINLFLWRRSAPAIEPAPSAPVPGRHM